MKMKRWKKNLYILMISQFLVMAAMTMIIPFLPLYLQELGVEGESTISRWTGFIFGINFLSAFLISPFWGKIADRKGRKMMILRSGFGMGLVIILTGFATGPWSLLFLRFINGLISGFIPAAVGLVAVSTPKKQAGYALGLLQASAVGGGIVGPLFGGLMAEWVGFRMIFYITGIAILIATIVVLIFVKEEFENKASLKKTTTKEDFKKIILNQPALLALFIVLLIVQIALIGINPLMSIYVQELVGNHNVAFYAGLAMAIMGFANMSASPYLGRLNDRKGPEKILFISLLAAALVTLPQAFVTDYWQLVSLRFLLGLTLGGLLPSINTLIRYLAEEGMESRTFGFSNSAMYLGNMLGPVLGGTIAGAYGIRSLFVISSIFLLINVCIVYVKIIPSMNSRKKKERKRE